MPYLIYAIDHDGMDKVREAFRQKHRDHLGSIGKKLLGSGALLSEDGEKIIGGLSILDTSDKQEAQHFADGDPYRGAGIRKETTVIKWRRRWIDGELLAGINS